MTEGSPISPVFASEAELIVWLVGQGYTRDAAVAFSGMGWAPSLAGWAGDLKRDIEACVDLGATGETS